MGARGVLRTGEGNRILFWCPGCKETHQISVRPDGQHVSPGWGFNGNYDKPSFTPSIKVTSSKIVKDENGKWTGDWERDGAGNLIPQVSHSFVTDG